MSRAMPWREFGGAAGPGGGGERAFPRPLGRRRGASSSSRGSSLQLRGPSARSHSSAACATRRRRGQAAAMSRLRETSEHPSCWRSTQGGRVGSGTGWTGRWAVRGASVGTRHPHGSGTWLRAGGRGFRTPKRGKRRRRASEAQLRLGPLAAGGAEGRGRAAARRSAGPKAGLEGRDKGRKMESPSAQASVDTAARGLRCWEEGS